MGDGRLHVGFVLHSLHGGGAERHTLHLAQWLVERGHRADLVIPCFAGDYLAAIPRGLRLYRGRLPHTDRRFLQEVQRSGAGVTAIGVNPFAVAWIGLVLGRKHPGIRVRRKRSLYASVHILDRYLRNARPHVLVSALPGADAAAVCAAELTGRTVPVVITVHVNVAADYAPEWLETARTLYPLADAVVAVSKGVAESVRRSLGRGRRARSHHRHPHSRRQHTKTGAGGSGAPLVRGRRAAGGPERRTRGAAEGLPPPWWRRSGWRGARWTHGWSSSAGSRRPSGQGCGPSGAEPWAWKETSASRGL